MPKPRRAKDRRTQAAGATLLGAALLAAAIGVAAGVSAVAAAAAAPRGAELSIPFTRLVLGNGLTVLFHEDHAIPTVVVDVSYNVGSRFELPGRTGFAHLFEHLMFMGTQRAPTKAFDQWLEAVGGVSNAFTSTDRTNFYDIGPPTALELMLWLEADRLRDLGPLMTREKLDAQRDVVRNERRQTAENTPYGVVELRLPELVYPEGHPYHHDVLGSHEDLEAASVDDVKAFFALHYRPGNATLIVAGDFEPAKARALIERWFSGIAAGEPQVDPGAPGFSDTQTTLKSVVRETLEDDVQLGKVVMAWQSPKHFGPGDAELDLLSLTLAGGKASRLYRTLVYEQKLAQSVEASQGSAVLGSVFDIDVTARPGVPLEKIEAAVDAELEKLRTTPIGEEELERAVNQFETAFTTRVEALLERAFTLAAYQAEVGDPGFAAKDLERYRSVTSEQIRDVARRVLLPDARVILRVVPKAKAGGA